MPDTPTIAVCDKDINCHEQIRALLNSYRHTHGNLEMRLCFFQTGEELQRYSEPIDLLFLDAELNGDQALSLIPSLQKRCPNLSIILISSEITHITDAHRLHVFQYLLKPFDGQIFFEELDRFYLQFHQSQQLYSAGLRGETVQFPIRDITCIEAELRHLIIHTAQNARYEKSGQIGKEEELLSPFGFIRCHNSYLFNPRHVKRLEEKEVVFSCGTLESAPISRARRKNVEQQYRRWLARNPAKLECV